MRVWPGQPYPLGATWTGLGVNFAHLFRARHARRALPVRFARRRPTRPSRIPLPEQTDMVWHGYLPDVRPGPALRLSRPRPVRSRRRPSLQPEQGRRSIRTRRRSAARSAGPTRCSATRSATPTATSRSTRATTRAFAPLAAVIDPAFTWGDDRPPRTPWHETVIYEMHVKGFTKLHPDVPEPLRGTYAALTSEPALEHLQRLGVTAVELMPVHHHADDRHLVERGLTNYWGYNTLALLRARHPLLGARAARRVGARVQADGAGAARAGLEVILDVVYNHTAEGNHLGPTLSLRGIDNASYYRLRARRPALLPGLHRLRQHAEHAEPARAAAHHGQPAVLGARDARRRLPLRPGERAGARAVRRRQLGAFFDIIHQDPVLSQVKLIAEPWDLGDGGYQVGNFPVLWTEWNGKYRDAMRRVLARRRPRRRRARDAPRGQQRSVRAQRPPSVREHQLRHRARRLHAARSRQLQREAQRGQRRGQPGRREQQPELELRRRRARPTTRAILALRERQKRNLMATLLLSRGVPMISGGDELGRTQHGNNNAYCQDNEISWTHWDLTPEQREFLDVHAPARALPALAAGAAAAQVLPGPSIRGADVKDIYWLDPSGREMTDEAWNAPFVRSLGVLLVGDAIDEIDERGELVSGDTLLMLLNAHDESVPFVLPPPTRATSGCASSTRSSRIRSKRGAPGGTKYPLQGRTVVAVHAREAPARSPRVRPRGR